MKKLLSILICLSVVLSLICAPALAEGVTYRMLYSGEMTTMNYLVDSTAVIFSLASNCMDTLVEYDKLGQIQPALATEWSSSEDGLTWTFKLRDNAVWVDGAGTEVAPVVASDFVASMKYILDATHGSSTAWLLTDIIDGAGPYYDGTVIPDEGEEAAPPTEWETVGVKAIDDHTLEYKLLYPAPYFLSMLDYVCFMPVNEAFLTEKGDQFGVPTGNDTLLYCGAYTLSEYKPQEKIVYSKNQKYWDAEQVHIDTIDETYNKETGTIGPEMFVRGEIDEVSGMTTTVAQQWLANPETADLLRPQKQTGQYSYFFCFNFDPQFDATYEPENWKIAVENENFRKSFYYGLDRVKAMTVHDADNPENLLYNTVTPPNIIDNEGLDYAKTGELAKFSTEPQFNEEKALAAKAAAMEELTAAGATFPIKVLMPYNPISTGWPEECQVVEQQLEALLGTDYIDIMVEAGPSSGFLGEVRRSGKYAFMKCNWGLDFADPVNLTEPFRFQSNNYNFLPVFEPAAEYYELVNAAKPVYTNLTERYEAFALAESWLIDHAIVIPFGSDEGGYFASRIDPFQGQHNACGLAQYRYKGQTLLDAPMSTDQFFDAYDAWVAAREALQN